MKTRIFYSLVLAVFCSFLLTGCPGTRETNVAVNTTNAGGGNAAAPKSDAPNETNKAAKTDDSKKPDDSKMTAGDPSKTTSSEEKFENRCGWLENPTPGNAWLTDKDGEWLISTQGGYQAEGDWGDFPDDRWVKTNVNYGYGCACLKATVDAKNRRFVKISGAVVKPLSVCRNDPALKEPKG